ncbi:MAG: response regulator [Oscillatoriales cyanobacterium C42_A2020_001]|nr:response regulator [Leptolyngbyaceae cyanobacterium C42_A2020_001]
MEEPINILIVDDDAVDRMAVQRALRSASVDVVVSEAQDYDSAIAALKAASFDCVFADYRLPDKDGLILVQDLRQQEVKTPIVMLTGQGDEQLAVELMKAGATDYLAKSKISPDILARTLRNAIRLHQAEMEANRAKQQQEQLARQREDFVYRLTHDLRTPLVAADRMLHLLQQEAFGPVTAEMVEALSTMMESNRNLLQMVNTILEVYRHDAGYKTLTFASCNLQQLVQDVAQDFIPVAEEKGLSLHLDFSEGTVDGRVVTIQGDCIELQRVLSHIVGNAIKFTQSGSITLRLIGASIVAASNPDTFNAESFVCIEVEDTGVGIAPADQETLFERYRQGDTKRAVSGLGLYLSRRIIEGHNGTIAVQSELGRGTLFTIRLPIQRELR